MLNIVFEKGQYNAGIGSAPNGDRLMQFIDPQSHITFTIVMDADVARRVGLQLASTVAVATGPLSSLVPPNGGKGG